MKRRKFTFQRNDILRFISEKGYRFMNISAFLLENYVITRGDSERIIFCVEKQLQGVSDICNIFDMQFVSGGEKLHIVNK